MRFLPTFPGNAMTRQPRPFSRSGTRRLIWRGLTCEALALGALGFPSVGAGQQPIAPAAPAEADTTPPPGVVESAFSFASGSLQLPGTLTLPARVSGKLPVAIIVAGSGPTDRNGNSLVPGVRPNTYAQLAWGLAQRGIHNRIRRIHESTAPVGVSQSNQAAFLQYPTNFKQPSLWFA